MLFLLYNYCVSSYLCPFSSNLIFCFRLTLCSSSIPKFVIHRKIYCLTITFYWIFLFSGKVPFYYKYIFIDFCENSSLSIINISFCKIHNLEIFNFLSRITVIFKISLSSHRLFLIFELNLTLFVHPNNIPLVWNFRLIITNNQSWFCNKIFRFHLLCKKF